ncbi:EndoU domain-containing protein [Bacillus sp. TL12]|uniref:EndoU domain-containing protein n=1 Tax=Bacillus sp. TL12 TaxID=2894756 RepID=UPI001F520351|nr:EndoU domain-containing protein [Bacillus sp. TL12]MCI0764384.1 EndoU domain-containing protein [Bacillus sp. TL12]
MSLNMYLGEVQSQTQSMNAVCTATIQGMEQAIQSIEAFASDTVLQGQTYDSAKAFFVEAFLPLAQGIIYLCEELIRQNDTFPSDFQSQVASTDVIEQEILEQIREIDRMKTSMEAVSQAMPIPGMDAMANLFTVMRKKLQEKLDHLYEFNQTSSNNYNTAIQLAASIAAGLAEVQSGKGFSFASGTFSTQGLNMAWADSIQEYLDTNIRLDNRIKSSDVVESDTLQDGTSEKNILEKVVSGVWYGSGQFIGGIVEFFDSLDDTVAKENMKYAIGHPLETASTAWNTFSNSFMNDVWNGDAESRTRWGTNLFMQVGLAGAGDKGLNKIGKVTTLGEGVNLAKFSEGISSVSNQIPLKDRFAFADGSGMRSKFNAPDFRQAKDTFLFFNPFKSHPNSIYKNNGTVEHIFHGNINREGAAGGYHHKSMMGKGGILHIIDPPDANGVYRAKVKVDNQVKGAPSTFFPDDWSRTQVLKAIEEAYGNARFQAGSSNAYIGVTSNGMKIRMFLTPNRKIISAFPIYKR